MPQPCLIFLVSANDLRQGVDGLGEDVGRDAAGHQDAAQLGEKAARLDRVLAAHGHLRHEISLQTMAFD